MTKIAYIRASQQNPGLQFHQSPVSSPVKSSPPPMMMSGGAVGPSRVFFQPPMPGAQPMLGAAFAPQQQQVARSPVHSAPVPKPLIMAPTTRFNSNPSVVLDDQTGGRISKPLMEKRRRARINQCLSQLKQVVVDSAGQYTENNKCKLEKADILELTVKYVKKLHQEVSSANSATSDPMAQSSTGYISGYSDCIRQICDFIADVPEATTSASAISLRDSLQSHLSQCLFTIQAQTQNSSSPAPSTGPTPPSPPNSSNSSAQFVPSTFCTPPSPAPSAESNASSTSSLSPIPMLTMPPPVRSLKREFSDDDDEYEDISDEDESGHYFDHSGPINLCKVTKVDGGSDTWRPW